MMLVMASKLEAACVEGALPAKSRSISESKSLLEDEADADCPPGGAMVRPLEWPLVGDDAAEGGFGKEPEDCAATLACSSFFF